MMLVLDNGRQHHQFYIFENESSIYLQLEYREFEFCLYLWRNFNGKQLDDRLWAAAAAAAAAATTSVVGEVEEEGVVVVWAW